MLADVVIDTDVLAHAENPINEHFQSSQRLLARLRACDTRLCLDEGFHPEEALNRSAILSEYIGILTFGSASLAFVFSLAANDRIRETSTSMRPEHRRVLKQLIWDKSDRKFVAVAANTAEKVLVSHDDTHYSAAEGALKATFGVTRVHAETCCDRL